MGEYCNSFAEINSWVVPLVNKCHSENLPSGFFGVKYSSGALPSIGFSEADTKLRHSVATTN